MTSAILAVLLALQVGQAFGQECTTGWQYQTNPSMAIPCPRAVVKMCGNLITIVGTCKVSSIIAYDEFNGCATLVQRSDGVVELHRCGDQRHPRYLDLMPLVEPSPPLDECERLDGDIVELLCFREWVPPFAYMVR